MGWIVTLPEQAFHRRLCRPHMRKIRCQASQGSTPTLLRMMHSQLRWESHRAVTVIHAMWAGRSCSHVGIGEAISIAVSCSSTTWILSRMAICCGAPGHTLIGRHHSLKNLASRAGIRAESLVGSQKRRCRIPNATGYPPKRSYHGKVQKDQLPHFGTQWGCTTSSHRVQ